MNGGQICERKGGQVWKRIDNSGANHRVASPLLGTSGSSIEHILDKAFVYCYTGTLGAVVRDAGNNTVLPHVILLLAASPRMLPVTSSMRR